MIFIIGVLYIMLAYITYLWYVSSYQETLPQWKIFFLSAIWPYAWVYETIKNRK